SHRPLQPVISVSLLVWPFSLPAISTLFPGCGLGRMPMPRGDDNGDSAVESGEMQAGFCEECREDKRHFFKIITNGSAKRLRIPPAFLEHINASSHHAILKGPSNNIWRVEVKQIRHGTIFMKGWKRFHRDHCLEFGDFLVFGYDGNMHFSVHIFDRSACEKESAFHVKNSEGNLPPTECQVGVESGNNMRAASRASEHKKGTSHFFVERNGDKYKMPCHAS
ncbi:B3 domain-containing protein, partial [Nymphaea thermarum]